jgi:hypothetical protein
MNRHVLQRAIWAALLPLFFAAPASAQTFLSNTPVTNAQIQTLFGGSIPTLWATASDTTGGVTVVSNVYRGKSGTAAQGLFLYAYDLSIQQPGPISIYVEHFTLDVPARVALNLDGSGGDETSAYCISGCGAAVDAEEPIQVVATGASVDFYCGILFTESYRLYLVSAHPPTQAAATITFAYGGGTQAIDVLAPSTSANAELPRALVPFGSPIDNALAALFGTNLAASPAGDGYALDFHFYTGARTGKVGTAAQGLYLYEYWFEAPDCVSGASVRSLAIPFESVVPLDVDADGHPEAAFFEPYGDGCGAATIADGVEQGGGFLRLHYPAGVAGGIANAFVISDRPPIAVNGILTADGVGSGAFATWSSAPEPASLLTGAAALLTLAALRQRTASRA